MPNIVNVMKEEMTRVARKELRKEVKVLKEASARARHDIAELKRRQAELERRMNGLNKQCGTKHAEEPPVDGQVLKPFKYSGKALQSLRKKLGLSAADFGKLIGVSQLSIYNWENGKARPREKQLAAIASIRGIGKREAASRLGITLKGGRKARKPRTQKAGKEASKPVVARKPRKKKEEEAAAPES